MQALLAALAHPEAADISILEQLHVSGSKPKWFHSTTMKSVWVALALFAAIIVIAVILQSIK